MYSKCLHKVQANLKKNVNIGQSAVLQGLNIGRGNKKLYPIRTKVNREKRKKKHSVCSNVIGYLYR